MSTNKQFSKEIISNKAKLITQNKEMIRLNNIQLAKNLEGKTKKSNKENNKKKREDIDELENLRKKYQETAKEPTTRKLFIKNIGNHFK